jgi:hypothetical protein
MHGEDENDLHITPGQTTRFDKKYTDARLTSRETKDLNTYHSIPESFRAFCSIVSFTAAKTNLMLVVSVACVRL